MRRSLMAARGVQLSSSVPQIEAIKNLRILHHEEDH